MRKFKKRFYLLNRIKYNQVFNGIIVMRKMRSDSMTMYLFQNNTRHLFTKKKKEKYLVKIKIILF